MPARAACPQPEATHAAFGQRCMRLLCAQLRRLAAAVCTWMQSGAVMALQLMP